jgi:hypothetical protein
VGVREGLYSNHQWMGASRQPERDLSTHRVLGYLLLTEVVVTVVAVVDERLRPAAEVEAIGMAETAEVVVVDEVAETAENYQCRAMSNLQF